MANEIDWAPIYRELAKKLLRYENDRPKLIEKLNRAYETSGVTKPNALRDSKRDIDPFTVFSLFNYKDVYDETRERVLRALSKEFSLSAPIPTNFDDLPSIFALTYKFCTSSKARDIDKFWRLFGATLEYADNPSAKNKEAFSEYFDEAIGMPNCGTGKITKGLYWIAPEVFPNLDSMSTWYLHSCESSKIPREVAQALPGITNKISAEHYFEIVKELNDYFESDDSDLKNFRELCLDAMKEATDENVRQKALRMPRHLLKPVEVRPVPAKKPVTKRGQHPFYKYLTLEQEDEQPSDGERQYWWLNANKNEWEFSRISVDEVKDFSLYKGKRRKQIYQNFLNAKVGDIVIGYQSTPTKKIVAICEISEEVNRNVPEKKQKIYIRKLEDLVSPVPYNELKNHPKLLDEEPFKRDSSGKDPFILKQGTLFSLTKDGYDLIMRLIREENPEPSLVEPDPEPPSPPTPVDPYDKENFLEEVFVSSEQYDTLERLLKTKKNIILQGPPGVGKTFAAKRLAWSILKEKSDNHPQIQFVQFHQSYSYEDFVEGYKPKKDGDGFELRKGVFREFCEKAASKPYEDFFFIIDEINRGNMSKIFGELLMLIEKDHRGETTKLAYSREDFSVPENVFIIGMMNTADRNLAMLDYALRRRFGFFDMKPAFDSEGFGKYQDGLEDSTFEKLIAKVKELNEEIERDDALGEGFCIGHSYFCGWYENDDLLQKMRDVVDCDILPTLREYWFENKEVFKKWETELRNVIS